MRYHVSTWLVAVIASLSADVGRAADSAGALQEVVVTGEQPGPALWQVRKGDHLLWVLGTVSALPRHMKWKTDGIEKALASSQVMLSSPGLTPDANIGPLAVVFLLPSLIGLGKLPDGASLQQVLPAPLYARWTAERQTYLGNTLRLEHSRPIIAADKLSDAAYDKSGLTDDSEVVSTVRKLARKYRLKRADAQYHVFIRDPKALVKDFKKASLDESVCFSYLLTDLDYSLAESTPQAKAWATGDVATLKAIIGGKPEDPCWRGFGEIPFIKELGLEDIVASVDAAWLTAAEKSLSDNQQSFTVLEMDDVLLPGGLLAMLEARGYTLQGPAEAPDGAR